MQVNFSLVVSTGLTIGGLAVVGLDVVTGSVVVVGFVGFGLIMLRS